MNIRRRLILVVGIMAISSWAWAQMSQEAPLNPEFLRHQAALKVKQVSIKTADGHGLGLVPSPLDLSHLRGGSVKMAAPASYDLRDHGKVSIVQDQGQYGNCWTFGTFGSMESCLLTGENWNFSENNLANLHGFDSAYGGGGDWPMSIAYLARWSGPVNETDDPYSNGAGGSPSGLTVRKHAQVMYVIPNKTSATDLDTLKSMIMTYGGYYTCVYWTDSAYNSATAAYYYNGAEDSNHAITMVGWDDTYSRSNFSTPPPGDGAFLLKNSWGASWGKQGYFWVSYYDTRVGTGNALFLNAEATSNYASIYQYDILGWCSAYGFGSTTAWGANIFECTSAGAVSAVSFYTTAQNASYEIYVYTGVSASQPRSGTLAATKTGTATYSGYYTVALDSPVTIGSAGFFSVVIKFTTPSYNYPVAVEEPINGYSSQATAAQGQSFISANGSSWEDGCANSKTRNCCIKAFGTGGGSGPVPPVPDTSYTPLMNDIDGDYYGDPTLYHASAGTWYFRLSLYGYNPYSLSDWGSSNYRGVAGWFDDDWLEDPTLYSTASGYWYSLLSSTGYQYYYYRIWWGVSGATPVCADFDGDWYADPTIYVSGSWYVLLSSYGWGAYWTIPYSAPSGLIPFGGDFDGDWYADPTFYSPYSGYWYILLSSAGYQYIYTLWFGISGSTPALGDFDGDFIADPILRSTTGDWYILLSTTNYRNYFTFSW